MAEFELLSKSGFGHLPGQWREPVNKADMAAGFGFMDLSQIEYALYTPHNRSCSKMPLVVMLHGCDQTATLFARGTRMNDYAEHHGFCVLYPNQNNFRHINNCWYWFDHQSPQRLQERARIAQLIEGLVNYYDALDASRVYLVGMSSGGGLAGLLATEYSSLFAGLCLHSTPMFVQARHAAESIRIMKEGWAGDPSTLDVPESYAAHPLPTLIIHGEKDDTVNPINAEQLHRYFSRLNRSAARRYKTKMQPVTLSIVPGLWHGWANGDANYRYNEKSPYDATQQLIRFFNL